MFTALYVSDCIGIALMIILLITNKELFTKEKQAKYLLYMVFITICTCLFEILASVFDGKEGIFATIVIYVGNSGLYIANLIISYYWIRLAYDCLGLKLPRPVYLATNFFNLLGAIIIAVNLFCPIVFSVENNVYQRESLFWIFVALGAVNIILGIYLNYSARKKKNLRVSFPVFVFVIPLAIGMTVQSVFYGVSLIWVSIAVGIVGITASLKNRLIYIDSLTGVYNTVYLQKSIRALENKEDLVLSGILIDINDFKKINDTLGHDSGDIALGVAAGIFYDAVKGCGKVIRIGGDEFLILVETRDPIEVIRLTHSIDMECFKVSKENNLGFQLSVSMGFAPFDNKKEPFDSFLKHLDQIMYEKKQEFHRLNDETDILNVKLGAFTLSSDILKNSGIGLWAYEVDEGKEDRMYVDDTMLSLMGLETHLSPEETYKYWYGRTSESSKAFLHETIEKMFAGQKAETLYFWNHPDGKIRSFRGGGTRNYDYKKGIRIEGTLQNVTETIHFAVNKQD